MLGSPKSPSAKAELETANVMEREQKKVKGFIESRNGLDKDNG